jgi:uncharacterized membrane protein (DUF106 family)
VRDQVSHPYKTIGKTIVLYILIFVFLDSIIDSTVTNKSLKNVLHEWLACEMVLYFSDVIHLLFIIMWT